MSLFNFLLLWQENLMWYGYASIKHSRLKWELKDIVDRRLSFIGNFTCDLHFIRKTGFNHTLKGLTKTAAFLNGPCEFWFVVNWSSWFIMRLESCTLFCNLCQVIVLYRRRIEEFQKAGTFGSKFISYTIWLWKYNALFKDNLF